MYRVQCPALIISSSASGQGKTMITAGLARYHRDHGRRVKVFKIGPDFIDPTILECASGQPVYQLDLWMVGERDTRALLYSAAQKADLILIEGAMGLFDGLPSSADLAIFLGIPVVILINARAMAQTFGAIAYGVVNYRTSIICHGVLANGISRSSHANLICNSVPPDICYLGWIPHQSAAIIPERHLGLLQASEIADLTTRIESFSKVISTTSLAKLPAPVYFTESYLDQLPPILSGVCIGIAKHESAFAFIYQANLDTLLALGARLVFFSPISDITLPIIDSLYLPGGYPELYLEALTNNISMQCAIREHYLASKPLYAECGGMLYISESITDKLGNKQNMVGLLPGHAVLKSTRVGLGMQTVQLPEGSLRGHTFHYSQLHTNLIPITYGHNQNGTTGEAVYRINRLTASYLHLYFASNPVATAHLFLPSRTMSQ